ncbi:hypothetical protein [Streptomyces sp. NPDC002845]
MQFQFEDSARDQLEAEGTVMLPLWRRGDTLAQALAVLHGIAEDPTAGRAERDDMIDAFAGLDRHTPRPVRAELVGWQNQGLITLSRVALPDVPAEADLLADPQMRWAIDGRWNADSPLRRAALAGLAYLRGRGAVLDDIDLARRRLPTPGVWPGTGRRPDGGSTGSGRATRASRTASPARTAGWRSSSPPVHAR